MLSLIPYGSRQTEWNSRIRGNVIAGDVRSQEGVKERLLPHGPQASCYEKR